MRIILWLCVFITISLALNYYLTSSLVGSDSPLKQVTVKKKEQEELRKGLEQIYKRKRTKQKEIKLIASDNLDNNHHFLHDEIGKNRPPFVYDLIARLRRGEYDSELSSNIYSEFRKMADEKPHKTFQELSEVVKLLPPNSHEEFEILSLISRIRDVQTPRLELLIENLRNSIPDEFVSNDQDVKIHEYYLSKMRFLLDIPMADAEKKMITTEILEAQRNLYLKTQLIKIIEFRPQEVNSSDREVLETNDFDR